jgi:hypothetical protein
MSSKPRFSRALGGGGAAMRAKEDITYLQSRLEERLTVLKTMYENHGWGVRSHNVLQAAAQVYGCAADLGRPALPLHALRSLTASSPGMWSPPLTGCNRTGPKHLK